MQQVILVVILATTIWLGVDASGRDWTANRFVNRTWKWVAGCLLLWIVAFPVYLVIAAASRSSASEIDSPGDASGGDAAGVVDTPTSPDSRDASASEAPPRAARLTFWLVAATLLAVAACASSGVELPRDLLYRYSTFVLGTIQLLFTLAIVRLATNPKGKRQALAFASRTRGGGR